MPRALLLSVVLAVASPAWGQRSARAEVNSESQTLVKLSVAAVDSKGNPVVDLRAADVTVREDGKSPRVIFFRFAGSKRETAVPEPGEFVNRSTSIPTVILLDRWNERMLTTATAWVEVTRALVHLESADGVYIYFLTNHGELIPVHALPGTDADMRASARSSPSELAAKLDDAVRKNSGFRDVAVQDAILRADTTFRALDALGMQMASIPGRKNLIWVTHGPPLAARDPFGQWVDFTPMVRNLGSAFVRFRTSIYTVDQSAAGAGAVPDEGRAAL
jgi:VWFA-related protein